MSGLVDVLEVYYDPSSSNGGGVFFIVRDKDRTGTIFRSGSLKGTPLLRMNSRDQSIMVLGSGSVVAGAFN
jgi:hypothetical protein